MLLADKVPADRRSDAGSLAAACLPVAGAAAAAAAAAAAVAPAVGCLVELRCDTRVLILRERMTWLMLLKLLVDSSSEASSASRSMAGLAAAVAAAAAATGAAARGAGAAALLRSTSCVVSLVMLAEWPWREALRLLREAKGPEGSAAALLPGSAHVACLATVPRLDMRSAPAALAAAAAAMPTAAAAVESLEVGWWGGAGGRGREGGPSSASAAGTGLWCLACCLVYLEALAARCLMAGW
jgi:hypothetical protein